MVREKQRQSIRWKRVLLFVCIATISFIAGVIGTYKVIDYKLRAIGVEMNFDLFK